MNQDSPKSYKIKRSAKMEFVARITLDDGTVIERTVPVEGGIPGRGEMDFSSIDAVIRSFDAYEREAIKASVKLREDISDDYMKEVSKKRVTGRSDGKALRGRVRVRSCRCLSIRAGILLTPPEGTHLECDPFRDRHGPMFGDELLQGYNVHKPLFAQG